MLAVSQALKQDMVALGMAEAKIAVHHTGLDHALFRPLDRATARKRIAAWPESEFPDRGTRGLIVSAGNLIPLKGQALVIMALQQLPDVHLIIAGNGPAKGALTKLAANLGLTDRIHFANYPPEQLATAFAGANAMVLPSQREGLANVWIEALACGTPLVITDVGGAREVVTDASAGRIVARTPAAIAAAVRELLTNPVSQDEVAANAARFSWERNAAELSAHWHRIAGR